MPWLSEHHFPIIAVARVKGTPSAIAILGSLPITVAQMRPIGTPTYVCTLHERTFGDIANIQFRLVTQVRWFVVIRMIAEAGTGSQEI